MANAPGIYALCCFLICYLLGSIPSGVLIARLFKLGDLRAIGSGSTGATNVVRAGGKLPGALTLLADIAKGGVGLAFAAMALIIAAPMVHESADGIEAAQASPTATALYDWLIFLPLFGTLLGHCYSPWLKFRGGKGIAVLIGSYVALDVALAKDGWMDRVSALPVFTLFYLIVWFGLFKMTRISSVGGMGASLANFALLMVLGIACKTFLLYALIYFLPATAFVIWRHRDNIRRLARGEESRFVARSKQPSSA